MLNVLLWQKIYFEVGNLIAEREIPMPGWQKIPTLEFYERHFNVSIAEY